MLHYKLHSDPNKQEAQDYLPARVLNERIRFQIPIQTQHIRLLFEMEGSAHWDIREVQFLDADLNLVDVMPSTHFSGMWISEGGGEQWLYTDLGKPLHICQVNFDWYQAPKQGSIDVSDDAMSWRRVADLPDNVSSGRSTISINATYLRARYVRVSMTKAGLAGYYALREMEVCSDLIHDNYPHREAGLSEGRYYLSGGNWLLQRASEVEAKGEAIATPDFDCTDWISATVPGTVLAS